MAVDQVKVKDDAQGCYYKDMHADMMLTDKLWGTCVRTDRL